MCALLQHDRQRVPTVRRRLRSRFITASCLRSCSRKVASKIPKKPNGERKKIAYHDPCYLGRHNDVYLAPRNVIGGAGDTEVVEMPRHGTKALCCGAGGGRFWMEEQTGKKVNIERAEEALATEADEIAVACPFCFVMLDDGVKELGA